MHKSRMGNNSTDIFCCLVGCPAPDEFRGEKLCARGCVGVVGTFCPPAGVLLLQKENTRDDLRGWPHEACRLWRSGGLSAALGGSSCRRDGSSTAFMPPARAGGRDHPGSVSAGLARFLLIGIGLLAVVALIACWMHRLPLVGAPLALALWTVAAWSWQRQAHSLAFRADTLMVRWLGRGPACSGLHALAQRSRAPRRRRWGEPSLDERIERVCGTGVEARENRLTLVG